MVRAGPGRNRYLDRTCQGLHRGLASEHRILEVDRQRRAQVDTIRSERSVLGNTDGHDDVAA